MHSDLDHNFHSHCCLNHTWSLNSAFSTNYLDRRINKPLNIHVLARAKPDETYCSEKPIAADRVGEQMDSHSQNAGARFRKVKGNSLEQTFKDTWTLPGPLSSDSTASVRGRVCHHSGAHFYSAEGSVHLKGGETIDDCVTSNSFCKSILLLLKGPAG